MRRLLIGAVLLAACAQAETAEQATARMATESAAARTAIDAINVRYEQFLNGNMADSVVALFAEDGVMMPPNAPIVSGRAAMLAYMTASPMPPGAQYKFAVADVAANGPIAIERGTYLFTMPAQGNTPAISATGKYLVHWHNMSGTWRQKATAWSDDAPAGPPGG